MSELTKEYFDNRLNGIEKAITPLATKSELLAVKTQLNGQIEALATKLATKAELKEEVDGLARMTQAGFEDLKNRLDVRERVTLLETDMGKIKGALQIT